MEIEMHSLDWSSKEKWIFSPPTTALFYGKWQQGHPQSRFKRFHVVYTSFRSMLRLEDVKRQATSKCLQKVFWLVIVFAALGKMKIESWGKSWFWLGIKAVYSTRMGYLSTKESIYHSTKIHLLLSNISEGFKCLS